MVEYQGMFSVLLLLATAGWLISYYFFQVHHNRLKENVWWMPPFLRMSNCNCSEIVESPFGRTGKRSNSYWGLWYYALLLALLIITYFSAAWLTDYIFILTLLALLKSLYLLWGLYTLKVVCRPCLGIHLINTAIFLIFLRMEWHNLFIG